jgi:L-rhamnose mutarotase
MNFFKTIFLLVILLTAFSFQCSQKTKEPVRYGSVIGLKPEKVEYYKQLHANAWPGVLKMIRECNIKNYSIYLKKVDSVNYYLFSYFEYAGEDFKADMAKMAADTTSQRWWKETDPCQIPIPNHSKGEFWSTMEEVFHSN